MKSLTWAINHLSHLTPHRMQTSLGLCGPKCDQCVIIGTHSLYSSLNDSFQAHVQVNCVCPLCCPPERFHGKWQPQLAADTCWTIDYLIHHEEVLQRLPTSAGDTPNFSYGSGKDLLYLLGNHSYTENTPTGLMGVRGWSQDFLHQNGRLAAMGTLWK